MGWVDFKSSDVHLGPWNQWVPSSKTPSISSFVWHLQYLPRWEKNLLQQPTGHSETHCYERGGLSCRQWHSWGEKSVLEGVSPLQNRPSSHPRTPASSEQTAHHCSLPLGSDPCAKKVFLREANSLLSTLPLFLPVRQDNCSETRCLDHCWFPTLVYLPNGGKTAAGE